MTTELVFDTDIVSFSFEGNILKYNNNSVFDNLLPCNFSVPQSMNISVITQSNVGNTSGSYYPYGSQDTSFFIVIEPSLNNNCRAQVADMNHYFTDSLLKKIDSDKWIKVTTIKTNILSFQNQNDVEDTLDYIFETVNNLLIENQFELINRLLDIIDVEDLFIDTIVGILTITFIAKDKLTSRDSFFQRAHTFINKSYFEVETNRILKGLE